MTVLFLAPRLPYPADTGGKIRTLNILKQLAQRFAVHLVCFSFEAADKGPGQEMRKFNVDLTLVSMPAVPIVQKIYQVLLNPVPFSISKYHTNTMHDTIRQLLSQKTFDAVHVDHLHMAHYQGHF